MVLDCCVRYQAQGESVCPVCHRQLEACRTEVAQAREYRTSAVRPECAQLIQRGILKAEDAGLGNAYARTLFRGNSARREVSRLLGVYYPEPRARQVLREIHDFKWLEAERAGFDIWAAIQPNCPLRAAALHWARRYQPDALAPEPQWLKDRSELPDETPSSALWFALLFLRTLLGPSRPPLPQFPREGACGSATQPLFESLHAEPDRPTAPYWATRVSDLPRSLQNAGRDVVTHPDSPWLVIPWEGVGTELPVEHALRLTTHGLQILTAGREGVEVAEVSISRCSSLEIASVLLLTQLRIIFDGGRSVHLRMNATGESKLRTLLQPFLEEVFPATFAPRPLSSSPPIAPLPGRFQNAVDKFIRPGESILATAVQDTTLESKTGKLFWAATDTYPAGVLVVTNRRIALCTATLDSEPVAHGCTTTLLPFSQIRSFYTELADQGSLTVTFELTGGPEAVIRFRPQFTRGLEETLQLARQLVSTSGATSRTG